MRPRGEREQPRAVPAGDAGALKRLVERGDGLRRPAYPDPALRERAVQVDEEVGVDCVRERTIRDLLGSRGIADPVEPLGQVPDQVVPKDRTLVFT